MAQRNLRSEGHGFSRAEKSNQETHASLPKAGAQRSGAHGRYSLCTLDACGKREYPRVPAAEEKSMKCLQIAVLTVILAACLSGQAPETGAQVVTYDYSAMYERLNPSIVKVHADAAHGSGFLVDSSGLIATNHHVVSNARYVAVEFPDRRKVDADIVILNSRYDFAILKVNRSVVNGLPALPLLPENRDAEVRPGIPVLAFGSPLSQTFMMTQGIVSKVEDHELLGDFLIGHGNSGGPLVNTRGEVIGINTFGFSGIAGAVRVALIRKALAGLIAKASEVSEPSAELLPNMNPRRYPTETLKQKLLAEKLDPEVYKYDGGKFVVTVITPVMLSKLEFQENMQRAANRFKRRGKKIKDASYRAIDEPFYEWHRTAVGELDDVVRIEIRPDFGLTAGSKWGMAFASLGGAQAAQNMHVNMEFKAEFLDFKLYKDGKLLIPITPGRRITDAAFSNSQFTFVDEAYSGLYSYDPKDFLTGTEFKMEIYDAREPEKVHKVLTFKADSKLIKAIRADFTYEDVDTKKDTLVAAQDK